MEDKFRPKLGGSLIRFIRRNRSEFGLV